MNSETQRSSGDSVVQLCGKLWRSFEAGRIWFDEYALGLTITIIGASNDLMEPCIREIPSSVLARYRDFLQNHLEPVNFEPSPLAFLCWVSDEEIAKKKKELKPKYVRLYDLIRGRIQ
jgi:hypothetical protein